MFILLIFHVESHQNRGSTRVLSSHVVMNALSKARETVQISYNRDALGHSLVVHDCSWTGKPQRFTIDRDMI